MGGVALDGHALIGSPSSHRENQQLLVDGEFLALILDDHISGPFGAALFKIGTRRDGEDVERCSADDAVGMGDDERRAASL